MKQLYFIVSCVVALLCSKISFAHQCGSCAHIVLKENKNQWHSNVVYKADLPFAALFLEQQGLTLLKGNEEELMLLRHTHHRLNDYTPDLPELLHLHAIKVDFLNSNKNAVIEGKEKLSEYFNYFIGNDRSKWASKVGGFNEVFYKDIYNGVDLRVHGTTSQPKFDWIVKAGNTDRASAISLQYTGANSLGLKDGSLVIETSLGNIVEEKPYAYQLIKGERVEVSCSYVLHGSTVSFNLPNGYNASYDLVIDPALLFSTYSGSTADNFGYTATYDSEGNAYTAGSVFGLGYPVTAGAYQTTWAGGSGANLPGTDIAITKFNDVGTARIYSTYLGGRSDELPHSLIVNTKDELFVFGTTSSNNFPVTVDAFQPLYAGGVDPGQFGGLGVHYVNGSDITISRFSADGTQLLASTYVGGTNNDGLNFSPPGNFLRYNYADEVRGEIDIDKQDNIYLATCTRSADFPTTPGAFQDTAGGGLDGIIIKMNNNLSTMVWCSYFGGEEDDAIYSLSLDKQDDLFVCGGTRSSLNFPMPDTTVLQRTFQGGRSDGFVALIDKSGSAVIKSTYWGAPNYDQIYFVENDRSDIVYVMGQTQNSNNFFIQNAGYSNANSGLFMTKMTHDLDSVIWSTTIGNGNGAPNISPTAFLVDLCNKVYATGWGANVGGSVILSTQNLPVTNDAYSLNTDNHDFYMIVLNDDASGLFYGTYFGSPTARDHVDGGTSRYSKKGILYQSVCASCGADQNFPITPNAASPSNNSPNCNNAVYKFDFNIPLVLADFEMPELPCVLPVTATFTNTSTVVSPTAYTWRFSDGFTSTDSNVTRTFTQPGLYSVSLIARDTLSCNGADTMVKTFFVFSTLDTGLALPTITICKSAVTQIGFAPGQLGNSVEYLWEPHPTLNELTAPNPFVSPDSTTTYTLYITNGICKDTLNQTVVVFSGAVSVSSSEAVCAGDSIQLTAVANSPGQQISFAWSPPSLIINGQGSATPAVSPPRDTTFTVVVTNQIGCTYTGDVFVDVLSDLPNLIATANPYTIGYGDTSQLAIVTSDSTVSVLWDNAETLSDVVSFGPVAYPLETTIYNVVATDTNGCFVTDTTIVRVFITPCENGGVYLPNAFTPNGDGKNDVLYLRGIRVVEIYLAIYDRWGQLMFETTKQEKGWDGTYGGKLLDAGVFGYYLRVKCDDNTEVKKEGNITLLR